MIAITLSLTVRPWSHPDCTGGHLRRSVGVLENGFLHLLATAFARARQAAQALVHLDLGFHPHRGGSPGAPGRGHGRQDDGRGAESPHRTRSRGCPGHAGWPPRTTRSPIFTEPAIPTCPHSRPVAPDAASCDRHGPCCRVSCRRRSWCRPPCHDPRVAFAPISTSSPDLATDPSEWMARTSFAA